MSAKMTILAAVALASPPTQVADRSDMARDALDKVSCRKSIETGSMLKQRMICRTQASWRSSIVERRDKDDYTFEEALLFETPAADQVISTGTADWEKLPPLTLRRRLPYAQVVLLVEAMLKKGECKIAGQSFKSFDIPVRFAVRVAPGGRATQVVVSDTGCERLNTLVGLIIFARSKRADIEPEASGTRWFSSTMNFTLR